MNNNDLAALAALGAMGYMYKRHLDGQGAEATGEKYLPAADFVNRDSSGVARRMGEGAAGSLFTGNGDAARDAGAGAGVAANDMLRYNRSDAGGGIRARDVVYGGGTGTGKGGGGGGGGGAAAEEVPVVYGNGYVGQQFPSNLPASTSVVPDAAPEDRGMGGAGLAAAGLGATGAGAAAYYAKVRREARLADEARAKMKAEAQRGILKDRAQTEVDADRDARARAQNEADRAARAQAQAEAEAKSRATQAEIDAELKKYKQKAANVKNDRIPVRAGVSKEAFAAGPTVTSASTTTAAAPPRENAARMTAAQKAAAKQAADMEEFNKQLRESKVGLPEAKAGPAETTTSGKAPRSMRGAATPAALAAMAVLAAAPDIASAGVQTYKGDTSGALQSLKDSKEALKALAMLPVDVSRAAMKGDFGPLKDLAMSINPATLLFNETSKHDDEAIKRMIEREKAAVSKKAAGGQIKTKKMASGGMTSTVSSASKRGDGIASKGKTRCKMY